MKAIRILPGFQSITDPYSLRWFKTAASIGCVFIRQTKQEEYMWRRLQLSQQQAEKQKKNLLQQTMVFHARADSILKDSCLCNDNIVQMTHVPEHWKIGFKTPRLPKHFTH